MTSLNENVSWNYKKKKKKSDSYIEYIKLDFVRQKKNIYLHFETL